MAKAKSIRKQVSRSEKRESNSVDADDIEEAANGRHVTHPRAKSKISENTNDSDMMAHCL